MRPDAKRDPRNLAHEEQNAREFSHVMTFVLLGAVAALVAMLFTAGGIWGGLRLWIYVGVVIGVVWALARERLGWLKDEARMRERRDRKRARGDTLPLRPDDTGDPASRPAAAPAPNKAARRRSARGTLRVWPAGTLLVLLIAVLMLGALFFPDFLGAWVTRGARGR